ncbi:spore germination protein [Metabacillus sp. Hm71]|uniref:spore germination protein n=1 Tax=Metabacillus sp. Hm71 TaxID=3450743 RepID=UPI003F423F24
MKKFDSSDHTIFNYEEIVKKLNNSPDLKLRELNSKDNILQIIFLNNLVETEYLNTHIIEYLTQLPSQQIHFQYIRENIPIGEVKVAKEINEVTSLLIKGYAYLFFSSEQKGILVNIAETTERALEKAETESLVYGPKLSFTESLSTNIKIVRRNINDHNLCTEEVVVGNRVKQKVRIVYIRDIANSEDVETIRQRLNEIEIDDIMDSSVLAQIMDDNSYSFFPQYVMTELPDRFVYSITKGRIGILVDRSPISIICPSTFFSFFESTEDIYLRWFLSSALRLLRIFAMISSIFFSAFYVAAVTYHYELIPSSLLINIGQSRAKVPFPPLLETLILEIMIELLREAGARLPSKVGQTMGIVGGIVLGQAVVQAGLTSNILIIIVSLSALGSFASPSYEMGTALRILRFPMILLAGAWGFNGIMIGVCILLIHLLKLTSLGRPFLSPLYPLRIEDLKYAFFRLPQHFYRNRATSNRPIDKQRLSWKTSNKEDLDDI